MLPSPVLDVDGYVSHDDLRKGRLATPEEGAAGRVLFYEVRYRFPVLMGPGETTDGATALLNTSVHDYPYTAPAMTVTSRPLPWSPHVAPGSGVVCHGFGWQRSRGRMLLAHAIVHVARLLNCDEEDRDPSYVGYNGQAVRYWRTTMGRMPLNPGLSYPTPSVEVTHGVAAERPLPAFRLVEESDIAGTLAAVRFIDDEPSGIRLVGGIS